MIATTELRSIASQNALSTLPAAQGTVGATTATTSMQSFKSLDASDGVFYARSINTLAVTKAGAVFEGVDFSGVQVNVQADNVQFRNCHFDARVGAYGVNAFAGTSNLTIDHCTFDGLKLDRPYADFVTSRGANTVITNSAFINAPEDALAIVSGKISGNYISGGGFRTAAHSDAIYIGKTIGPVTIDGNIVDWRTSAGARAETNNAVRVTGEAGNVANVLVTKNILLGGSNTVLVTDGATITHTAGQIGSVTGVRVVDNVVDFGKYGNLYLQDRPADLVYTGNHYATGPLAHAGSASVAPAINLSLLHAVVATTATATLNGTAAADKLIGGAGTNLVMAGSGDDYIQGNGGRDFLSGGLGRDVFAIKTLTDGRDFVSDFIQGQDKIDLSALAPGMNVTNWTWAGAKAFTGAPWQLHYIIANGKTVVELDKNGDMQADFAIDLQGSHAMTLADFVLSHSGVSLQPVVTAPSTPILQPTTPTEPAPSDTGNSKPVTTAGAALAAVSDPVSAFAPAKVAKVGSFAFTDADIGDGHHVSVSTLGAGYIGSVTATVAKEASGQQVGAVTWKYEAATKALDALSAGEVAHQRYVIRVDDGEGGVANKVVAVTLTGTEDKPKIAGSTQAAAYEGQSATISKHGVLNVSDIDRRDTLTTSVVSKEVHLTGAAGQDLTHELTTAQLDQFKRAMDFDTGAVGGNKGTADWSFTLSDQAIRFLDAHETLSVETTVAVADQHGGRATTDVVITLKGVDDHASALSAAIHSDYLLV